MEVRGGGQVRWNIWIPEGVNAIDGHQHVQGVAGVVPKCMLGYALKGRCGDQMEGGAVIDSG